MIKIKKVDWISQDTLEAEVILTDDVFELLCMSQPFDGQLGDFVKSSLYIFEATKLT